MNLLDSTLIEPSKLWTINWIEINDVSRRTYSTNSQIEFKTTIVPFTYCINLINKIQVDNAKGQRVVIPMYNLIEYSGNYSKTFGILWQHYRNKPGEADIAAITGFKSFKSKVKLTRNNVEIEVSLKYLSNIWNSSTLELSLTSCDINVILTRSAIALLSIQQTQEHL